MQCQWLRSTTTRSGLHPRCVSDGLCIRHRLHLNFYCEFYTHMFFFYFSLFFSFIFWHQFPPVHSYSQTIFTLPFYTLLSPTARTYVIIPGLINAREIWSEKIISPRVFFFSASFLLDKKKRSRNSSEKFVWNFRPRSPGMLVSRR